MKTNEMMTGGQLVVKVLEEFGTKVVFGIPGGQTLSVNNALYDSKVRFVHTRHENGAACAADAWGRLTGEPGICLATTGPGATNLITGLGGALRDSSPVIALVFQNKLPDAGRGDAQESDHELLFNSLCKKYIAVRDASSVVWAMREAYRTAKTGRPGPVVVDLYRDVVEDQKAAYVYEDPKTYCYQPQYMACNDAVEKAAGLIKNAKKITLWIGNGVKIAHAQEEIKALSLLLEAPVVTTYNAIATLESDFPNLVGPRSRHGSVISRAAIEDADCVLVVGSSLTAISTNRWALKPKNIIQFDIIPENIGRQYPAQVGVLGDAKLTLRQLCDKLKGEGYRADRAFRDEIFARKAVWQAETLSGSIADVDATPVPPIALHIELSKILKEDTIMAVDAGNPGAWTHITHFPRGTTYLKPVNYGNMGFAIPAAIACKCVQPEREVIALLGDGSLGMTMGDLETAAREKLPIIILLVNDNAYGNIKQEELFKTGKERYTGVEFTDRDYVDAAKSLGCDGTIVRKATELTVAFEKARASECPFLIEVKLDGSYSVWPECF
ncbi:MAG: thiamine pyrophosphate-binding protein [Ruminococcaceae bacterium]|nr:thiamine pyrophosphate-binding protein [Oscillospiraceae bacterium]